MEEFIHMSMREQEFLAEDEVVTIVPRFSLDKLRFIGGDFGPLVAGMPVRVPLWLAMKLKDEQMCQVQCPDWMLLDNLKRALEVETSEPASLTSLPFYFQEIAALMLSKAADDIPDAEAVSQYLRDIEEQRAEKLRQGRRAVLESAQDGQTPSAIKLTNIAAMEVASIRHDFFPVLDMLHKLGKAQEEADAQARERAAAANNNDNNQSLESRFEAV